MFPLITVQQSRHYAQFGWIEFEAFLSEEEAASTLGAVQEALSKRLKGPPPHSTAALYEQGRDLWRISPALKTLYGSRKFGAAAAALSHKQSLLVACDQWIPGEKTFEPLKLEAHLSFQNLACACLLSLESEDRRNVRFIHPDRLPLFPHGQLLVVFGTPRTVYIHNPNDPHVHGLKQFGYAFGDCLNPSRHPKMASQAL